MTKKHYPKPSTRQIYGNVEAYGGDPVRFMFRCSIKRAQWYLDRGLAKKISWDDDPGIQRSWKSIELLFQPNGPGQTDEYYRQVHLNRCCVCGSEKDLAHHHVVPSAYRRWFPPEIKNFSHHDVLPLCVECKKAYDPKMAEMMKELAAQHLLPSNGLYKHAPHYDLQLQAKVAACALVGKHKDKIPAARKRLLLNLVHRAFDAIKLDEAGLRWVAALPPPDVTPAGKIIVEKVLDSIPDGPDAPGRQREAAIRHLAVLWRQHFVSVMKPQYLPIGWDVCRMKP